jgi:hypothetical protein
MGRGGGTQTSLGGIGLRRFGEGRPNLAIKVRSFVDKSGTENWVLATLRMVSDLCALISARSRTSRIFDLHSAIARLYRIAEGRIEEMEMS